MSNSDRQHQAIGAQTRLDTLLNDDKRWPTVVYGLYLLSLPLPFIAAIIGAVIAHLMGRENGSAMTLSHFDYQLSTFWIYLGAVVVAFVLAWIPIIGWLAAWLIGLGSTLWLLYRSVKGLLRLSQGLDA